MRRWLVVVLLVAGCGDECHQGESRCGSGGLIYTCDEGDVSSAWTFRGIGGCCSSSTCVDTDVDGNREGVCSDSGALDPRCAGHDGTTCVDATTSLVCNAGYGSSETACSGVCVEPMPGQAFCAEAASDVRCAAIVDSGTTCDGTDLLECIAGALVDDTACGVACAEPMPGHAFCSTGTVPDPRCATGPTAWCDGVQAMTCLSDGFVVVDTCDATSTCNVATLPDGTIVDAYCNTPTPSTGCVLPNAISD